jgi:hypothetical protein
MRGRTLERRKKSAMKRGREYEKWKKTSREKIY